MASVADLPLSERRLNPALPRLFSRAVGSRSSGLVACRGDASDFNAATPRQTVSVRLEGFFRLAEASSLRTSSLSASLRSRWVALPSATLTRAVASSLALLAHDSTLAPKTFSTKDSSRTEERRG